MCRAHRSLSFLLVVVLLVGQMVIATPQPAMAAGNFIGGADRYPLYVVNDHTAYAVHFVASGLTPNTTYKVWARFCPEPYPGGGNQWGYTWNADTQQWIQEREDNELQGHFTSDASGVIPGGGWLYVKYGCEGNTSGDNLVISMEPVGVSSATLNSETSTTPSVAVLDADTQGSWIHNGVATGHQAAKRADVTSDTVSTEIYSLHKTEANVLDDEGDGSVDNENYGPAGATGDFRFGVPTNRSVDVRLNQTAWAPGNNFTTGPADVDLAVAASETVAPDAPTGLTATAHNGSVDLSWNAASDNSGGSGVTSYNVYRWTDGTDDYHWTPNHVPIANVTSGTTYTDSSVTNDTKYYYEVRAVDASTNVGPRSGTADATPDGTPPADVTNLAVVDFGSTDATLTWTAPGDDGSVGTATAYDLRYSTSPITDEAGWLSATSVPSTPTLSLIHI